MPLLTIPPNVTPGGQILYTDLTTLYNAINGGLDATNIAAGSLTGTAFAANSISNTKLKSTSATVGVQQVAAKHMNGAYITLPSATMFYPGLSTDNGAGTIGSFGGWRMGTAGAIGGGSGVVTVTAPLGDNSTDFNWAGGVNAGGVDTSGAGIARVAANTTPQYIIWLAVLNNTNIGTNQAFMTAFYLQASPPYDLGDGEIPLFIYALVDKHGNICATYASQDPPWLTRPQQTIKLPVTRDEALADPTKMAAYLDALDAHAESRRGLKKLMDRYLNEPDVTQKADLKKSIVNLGSSMWEPIPDTQEYKNRHMAKIPHPFVANDLENGGAMESVAPLSAVLLDPMDKNTQRLALLHESGENVNSLIHEGHVTIGNTHIANRKGPPGVMIVSHGFKNSGGR